MPPVPLDPHMPPRFANLKREIATSIPDFEARVTRAWVEVLEQLKESTAEIAKEGPAIIPEVSFADLDKLTPDQVEKIKRHGCVIIKDVVDDAEAQAWKFALQEFDKANPTAPGFPEDDKQFFYVYWTKPQVEARAHPNVLKASAWLNKLYHVSGTGDGSTLEDVDLGAPLTYADRYRIRKPGVQWEAHPPHVDGGSIERWEDKTFRTCFADILRGDWRKHDPYELEGRINARNSIYGRPNQTTIFRTFQGWLAMSETAPSQGTIRFFPDVLLSNAYMILRPFFRAKATPVSEDPLAPENWEYDISVPEFPGIYTMPDKKSYTGPRPTPELHPHLRLEETMTSAPLVKPGDMVFWHCDLVHSVEREHNGTGDSSVMYIGAVPSTPHNLAYIARQRETFEKGIVPPDYPAAPPEATYKGIGRPEDIIGEMGRRAMGFPIAVA